MLVQFVGPVKDDWLAKLGATGATVLGYAAQNGYIVHAAGDALDRVTELVGSYPAVRAATPLRPSDKVERGARERPRGRPDRGRSPRRGRPRGRRDAGHEVAPELSAARVRTQFLELDAAEVAELAPTRPWWRSSRPGCRSCTTSGAPRSWPGISPGTRRAVRATRRGLPRRDSRPRSAFAIDVTDSGLDRGGTVPVHPDLLGRVELRPRLTADPDATDCGGHGTNVTSIAAGLGTAAGQDAAGLQARPRRGAFAQVGASKIFRCNGAPRLGQLRDAHVRRLGRRGAHLEQLLGHLELRRLPRRLAGLRRSRPRRLVRHARQPGDGRGLLRRQRRRRQRQPGRPEGRRGLRQHHLAGHREERDHGRRGRERARARARTAAASRTRAPTARATSSTSRPRTHQDGRMKPDLVAPARTSPAPRRSTAATPARGLQQDLRRQRLLLARVGHLAGRAARGGRGRAAPRLVRPDRERRSRPRRP